MVFFDIDDTLTDSDGAHLRAIRCVVMDKGICQDPAAETLKPWLVLMEEYLQRYFRGELSLEQQRTGRVVDFFATLGVPLTTAEALALYAEYHGVFLDHCTPFDDVQLALAMLADHRLGIISNGVVADQRHKLSNNGLLSFFEPIVISEAVGTAKPDARLFRHAAALAGVPIEACSYIGNSYELDYLGAAGAGMAAYWLDRGQASVRGADAGYGSLTEIVDEILRRG